MARLTGHPPKTGPGASRRPSRRASEPLLGEIGADAPFGIVVADPDLLCTGANASFAALVGVDEASAVGRGLSELLPGASPALFEAARGVIADGRPRFRIPVVLEVSGQARRADFTLYRTDGFDDGRPRVVALARDLGTLPNVDAAERSARLRPEAVAERLARLQEVTAALSAAVTEEEVAQVVLGVGLHVLGASGGSLCFP